jgi:4,5-dihydroxyphthalate decarboxylase
MISDMASNVNASLIRFPHVESILNEAIELSDGTTFNVHETVRDLSPEESLNYDVWELPIVRYIAALELGLEVTAIPVFTARRFIQWMVEVPENSEIQVAQDLEGKRIAQHNFGNTDAVWTKGVLEESYGVDPLSVSWFTVHAEMMEGLVAPAGVVCLEGADPNELLANGVVDAAIVSGYGPPPAPGIRRLWADPEVEAAAWYRTAKMFPILHVIVIRDSALDEHESLARDIYQVFDGAKHDALVKWDYGASLPEDRRATAQRSGFPGPAWGGVDRSFLGRDPLQYGLEPNRGALERIIQYGFRQKATQKSYAVDELFAAVNP